MWPVGHVMGVHVDDGVDAAEHFVGRRLVECSFERDLIEGLPGFLVERPETRRGAESTGPVVTKCAAGAGRIVRSTRDGPADGHALLLVKRRRRVLVGGDIAQEYRRQRVLTHFILAPAGRADRHGSPCRKIAHPAPCPNRRLPSSEKRSTTRCSPPP